MKESEVTVPVHPEPTPKQGEHAGDQRLISSTQSVGRSIPPTLVSQPTVDRPAPLLEVAPFARVVPSVPGEVDKEAVNALMPEIAEGKCVLVIAATEDARRSFISTIQGAGLAPVALNLDSRLGSQGALRQLQDTIELGPPIVESQREAIEQRDSASKTFQIHLRALGQEVRRTGVRGYEALALAITSGSSKRLSIDLSEVPIGDWDRQKFEKVQTVATRLDECISAGGLLAANPWRGCAVSESEAAPGQEQLTRVRDDLSLLEESLKPLIKSLGFSAQLSENSLRVVLEAATIINSLESDTGKAFAKVNLRSLKRWQSDKDAILDSLRAQLDYEKQHAELRGVINFQAFKNIDIEGISQIVAKHKERGALGRLFHVGYYGAVEELAHVCNVPESVGDVQRLTDSLVRLRMLQITAARTESSLEGLFKDAPLLGDPEESQDPLTRWRQRAQVAQVICELCELTQELDDDDRSRIFSLLRNPQPIYDHAEQLHAATELLERYTASRKDFFDAVRMNPSECDNSFFSRCLEEQGERFQSMLGADGEWGKWRVFSRVQGEASAVGLSALASSVYNGEIRRPSIAHELQHAWYQLLAAEVNDSLPSASRRHHERGEVARRLIEADRRVHQRNAQEVALQHWKNVPRYDTGGEAAILHERLLDPTAPDTLAALCREAPHAVQGVKPLIVVDQQDREALDLIQGMHFDLVVLGHEQQMPEVIRDARISGEDAIREFPIDRPTRKEVESPKDTFQSLLEAVVKKEIRAPVRSNVSTEGGLLDLVVFDPKNPSRAALVILLDKPRGVEGAPASEAELTREGMSLKLTGRASLREWIVDWYRDPTTEVKRFIRDIRSALSESQRKGANDPLREIERIPLEEDHLSIVAPYKRVVLDGATSQIIRRNHGAVDQSIMRDVLTSIIQQEGPIHRDDVLDRYAELSKYQSGNEDLQLRVVETLQQAIKDGAVMSNGDTLHAPSIIREIRPRSRADLQGGSATFARIPPEELETAVRVIVKHARGIPRAELPRKVVQTFGYKRLPCGAEAVVMNICNELVRGNIFTEDREILRINRSTTFH